MPELTEEIEEKLEDLTMLSLAGIEDLLKSPSEKIRLEAIKEILAIKISKKSNTAPINNVLINLNAEKVTAALEEMKKIGGIHEEEG